MGEQKHILINIVDECLIDSIIKIYDPKKIVIFATDEEEFQAREEFERLYPKYKDLITLYEGGVTLNTRAYMERNKDAAVFYTVKCGEIITL